jgi:hypothetical protein
MKPKVPFDPEFAADARRWYWPIRSIGPLMIVVALGGLTLWAAPMKRGGKASGPSNLRRVPAGRAAIRGPLRSPPAQVDRPRDRFVIMTCPEIDPAMVILAPEIDAGMVVHPGTPGRASSVAPRVDFGPLRPGQPPAAVPDRSWPDDWYLPPDEIP